MLIIQGEPLSPEMRAGGVGMSLIMAYLTYRYIEAPLRRRRDSKDIAFMTVLMILIVAASAYISHRDGLPGRHIQEKYGSLLPDSNHEQFFTHIAANFAECAYPKIREAVESHLGVKRCAQTSKNKEPEVLIIGDSHGEHLFIGLAQTLGKFNVAYYSFRCLPFFGVYGHEQCMPMDQLLHLTRDSSQVKVVVLAASWPGKIRRESGLYLESAPELTHLNLFSEGLDTTLKELVGAGKKVMVIGDSPSFPFNPIECIMPRPFSVDKIPRCKIDLKLYLKQHQQSWSVIERVITKHKHTAFFNPESLFCNGVECSMRRNDKLLFRDNDHLSIDGSVFVGHSIGSKILDLEWLE